MSKPRKPKISDFIDGQTGEFDIQGYDSACDSYEEERENYSYDDYDAIWDNEINDTDEEK